MTIIAVVLLFFMFNAVFNMMVYSVLTDKSGAGLVETSFVIAGVVFMVAGTISAFIHIFHLNV